MAELIDQIGAYRIVRPLGKGGMGAVYEVVHEKLGVHYALKTFTLDHGYVDLLKERFLAEGRVLARLRHPNLVRVFDLDVEEATHTPYFVMDLVLYKDGDAYTLADLESGGADEDHLARWFAQLCSALDYIHKAGIVHRDIKPGNILLDSNGGVVLGDFGVSRFYDGELRRELAIDHTVVSQGEATGKLVMGTSGYIAPEVKRGETATPAADAYSLGVVFFRLLTGVWYENRPNVWTLLDPFEPAWREILRRLLAEDPHERPIPLAPMAQMLKGDSHKALSGRRISIRIIGIILAAVVLVLAAVFAFLHFRSDTDTIRTDDLYSIPSCIPD